MDTLGASPFRLGEETLSHNDVTTRPASANAGRPFAPATIERLYAAHRERLIAAGFPAATLLVFGVTLLYQLADLIASPVAFRDEFAINLLQLLIPLVALALARGPLRHRVHLVALGMDFAYTAALAGRLLLPTTTVSGTALFLSLKMLATALLFPWGVRTQYVSAGLTLTLYWSLLVHEQTALPGWPPVHQLLGPLISALLSVAGAAGADRARRTLFLQNLRLARSQRRRATSEARYRDLFEHANDLIFVIDDAEQFRFANQAALDFVGVDAHTMAALPLDRVLPPESLRRVRRRLVVARARGDGRGRPFEVDVTRPDGSTATLELRARRVSEAGQAHAYQCIARDVSERHRQEAATQRLLRSLQESSRLQTEFVANTSHELRTPLSVIVGYADLLTEDPRFAVGTEVRGFLERIGASARALHRLVEGVLEFARLDRGQVQVMPSSFPVNSLLLELRSLCNDIRSSPDLEIHIPNAPGIELHTDYDRLYSVLSNLLLNAVKFTPRGLVGLTTQRVGDEIEFRVHDTGIGIPDEELEHIFEPFRQVDGSTTRAFTGVGLGLSIVQRNVHLLGGEVVVDSRVAVGSTFTVRIPRRSENVRSTGVARAAPRATRQGASVPGRVTVSRSP